MTPTEDDAATVTRRRSLPSVPTAPGTVVWLTDLDHMPAALPAAVYYALVGVEDETLDCDRFSEACTGIGAVACEEFGLDPELSPLIEREVVRRVAAAAGHRPPRFLYPDPHALVLLDALPRTALTALVRTARQVLGAPTSAPAATRTAAMARTDRVTTHTDVPAGRSAAPRPSIPPTAGLRR